MRRSQNLNRTWNTTLEDKLGTFSSLLFAPRPRRGPADVSMGIGPHANMIFYCEGVGNRVGIMDLVSG